MPEIRKGLRWSVRAAVLTCVALPVAACADPLNDPAEADAARAHLETVLDVMEANSINRNSIDWAQFRTTVRAEAPDPQQLGDIFEAIRVGLGLLADNQSSYIAPPEWGVTITNSSVTCGGNVVPSLIVPTDIAYVRATAASGAAAFGQPYANTLHNSIRTRDAGNPTGWIVDLRGNGNISPWPMIAGLGPLLGEGTLGFFLDPDGGETPWGYQQGQAMRDCSAVLTVNVPHTLASADPRVAVLIDGRVANAGEQVAIAFKGRPNTRFFGTTTCGLSTATSSYGIEGAALILTVARLADRNKNTYSGALPPDEVLATASELSARAIEWLRGG